MIKDYTELIKAIFLTWFLMNTTVPCLRLYADPHYHHNAPLANNNKSVEKTLIRFLLKKYEKFGVVGRPVQNSNTLITVNYGLALIQILDLDENKQILRTNCWSRYQWHDALLHWNPAEYAGIRQVRVFPHQLWTPDIKLYNFADERLKEHRDARVVVHNDTSILWIPQTLYKSTCSVEITYFPFDTQVCNLDFGSWTYDISQLDIQWWNIDDAYPSPYVDFNDYVVSNEWITDGEVESNVHIFNRTKQIKSRRFFRNVSFTDSDGRLVIRRYPVLQYRVRLKRNPSFYVSILVIPCILLSCLTLVLFWLPPESPAKMMLGMNIFVAFFVLLLLLAESTPSAVKNFPLIGGYYCLNMVMITLSTFLAVIVINLYFRGDRRGPVPPRLRRIMMEGLGRLLLVRQNIPLPEPGKTTHRAGKTYRSGHRKERRPRSQAVLYNKFQMNELTNHGETVETRYVECPKETSIDKKETTTLNVQFADDIESNICSGEVEVIPREALPTTASGQERPSVQNQRRQYKNEDIDTAESPLMGVRFSSMLERDVREIKRYIRMFVSRQKDKERKNQIAMEWRTVALVLDRLFFCLYVIAITVAIIILLPKRA